MNELSIGIFLNNDFDPKKGGAFSYYERLVEAIDQYEFDSRIRFTFISIGEERALHFKKNVLFINPSKKFTRKEKLIGFLHHKLKPVFLRRIMVRNLNKKYSAIYRHCVETTLFENGIDILYFLTPNKEKFNFPSIETHWDNGHLSMFAFPEVTLNNTYEIREDYINSLKKAFAIFCESFSGKKELLSFVKINPDRIFVVPVFPGRVVELEVNQNEQAAILDKYGLSSQRFFFYPAQFWSHKNHTNLLIAFHQTKLSSPDIKLMLSGGDKGNLGHVKKLVEELQLQESVIIPGFVSNEEIYCFYKNAAALVMPTYLGPTNLPLLEASELNCPVICSDFEGHREQLGDYATYIKPQDPSSISEAMNVVLQGNPKLQEHKNVFFSLKNALHSIEQNLLAIMPYRKTFGNNVHQF